MTGKSKLASDRLTKAENLAAGRAERVVQARMLCSSLARSITQAYGEGKLTLDQAIRLLDLALRVLSLQSLQELAKFIEIVRHDTRAGAPEC